MSNDAISAYNPLAGPSLVLATAPTPVPLTAEHGVSSDTFDLANDEVEVTVGGRYEINADASVISVGGNRTQAQGWIERNGVEIPGTRMLFYCRQNNHGASASKQIKFNLAADDTVRLVIDVTAGTGTVQALANGCSLTLRRM